MQDQVKRPPAKTAHEYDLDALLMQYRSFEDRRKDALALLSGVLGTVILGGGPLYGGLIVLDRGWIGVVVSALATFGTLFGGMYGARLARKEHDDARKKGWMVQKHLVKDIAPGTELFKDPKDIRRTYFAATEMMIVGSTIVWIYLFVHFCQSVNLF